MLFYCFLIVCIAQIVQGTTWWILKCSSFPFLEDSFRIYYLLFKFFFAFSYITFFYNYLHYNGLFFKKHSNIKEPAHMHANTLTRIVSCGNRWSAKIKHSSVADFTPTAPYSLCHIWKLERQLWRQVPLRAAQKLSNRELTGEKINLWNSTCSRRKYYGTHFLLAAH